MDIRVYLYKYYLKQSDKQPMIIELLRDIISRTKSEAPGARHRIKTSVLKMFTSTFSGSFKEAEIDLIVGHYKLKNVDKLDLNGRKICLGLIFEDKNLMED